MPRFHFNVHDGASASDEDGTDLLDFETARTEVVRLTGELLRDQAHGQTPINPFRIEVTDGNGNVLLSISVMLTYHSSPNRRFIGDAVRAMA